MIVGVVLAVLLIIVAAVLVYMFCIAADNDKIPRTSTLNARAVTNPMYSTPGVDGAGTGGPSDGGAAGGGGGGGVTNPMYGTSVEQGSAERAGGAVSNPTYGGVGAGAGVSGAASQLATPRQQHPQFAVPSEDGQMMIVQGGGDGGGYLEVGGESGV